jgi:hypothetical protein
MKLSLKIAILFLLAASVVGVIWLRSSLRGTPPSNISQTTSTTTTQQVLESKHGPCLADDEYADYPRKNKDIVVLTTPSVVPVSVSIYDKKSGQKKVGLKYPIFQKGITTPSNCTDAAYF